MGDKRKNGDSKTENRKKARTYIPQAPQKNLDQLGEINTQSINPNACIQVKPSEPTTIKMNNDTTARHVNHPINKFIK